ncbi:MAG: leucyl/phenylalanyl-tRNA--protein transferase [Gammaproteobacteria bacterium]|nr:leucyl/phenylalanyl-tRNA--protein transferase [Gammaproteobacteria bacterium]
MTVERGLAPFWLDPDDPDTGFPDVEQALKEPDGLLAIGGDLSVPRLLAAYSRGIFPWYGPGQPILWWSPDPRLVLRPRELRISRSLARTLRKATFKVTLDIDFAAVVAGCAAPRTRESGTWITGEMQTAYAELHRQGYAHSVECWQQGRLVGGLYGVSIGRVFFGESMFTLMSDASKVALAHLARQLDRWEFPLIDCQIYTRHLEGLGATSLPRPEFTRILEQACALPPPPGPWAFEADLFER